MKESIGDKAITCLFSYLKKLLRGVFSKRINSPLVKVNFYRERERRVERETEREIERESNEEALKEREIY